MATTTRRTLDQLPQIFQTDKNKRFLTSTLDQLTQPGLLTKVDGYIGSKTSKVFKSTDRYVKEGNEDRQDYQLEPATTYVDKDGLKKGGVEIEMTKPNETQAVKVGGQKRMLPEKKRSAKWY